MGGTLRKLVSGLRLAKPLNGGRNSRPDDGAGRSLAHTH
jgi:hypothetical protein